MTIDDTVNVRYMVDDVASAVDFYTTHFGFETGDACPGLRRCHQGAPADPAERPASSAGRPMSDGAQPGPGGWNRIHFITSDLDAEVARLRAAGVRFRNDVVSGPGGRQILLEDPSGNLIELFQPARTRCRMRCARGSLQHVAHEALKHALHRSG